MENITVSIIGLSGIQPAIEAIKKPYNNPNANAETLHKIAKKLRHESVLEHIIFTFEIDGSSRLELQEHMRHRIASPTVKSTRYTLKELVKDYNNKIISNIGLVKKYTVIPSELQNDSKFLDFQLSQLTLLKEALELYNNDTAKYFVPESFRTSFVWTINMRSLLNFLELRMNSAAHFEIRYIANLIYNEVSKTDAGFLL